MKPPKTKGPNNTLRSEEELKQLYQKRLDEYFTQLTTNHSSKSHSKAIQLAQQAEKIADTLIFAGSVVVREQPVAITNLLKPEPKQAQQPQDEQQTLKLRIAMSKKELEKQQGHHVAKDEAVKDAAKKLSEPLLILSKDEHYDKVQNSIRIKRELNSLHQAVMQEVNEASKKVEPTPEEIEAKLQEKKKIIIANLERQKAEHEEAVKRQKESRSKLKELMNAKPLHQLIEERYRSEANLQKEQILESIRIERNQSLSYYDGLKKRTHHSQSQSTRNLSYGHPPKSEKLIKILEDELAQKKRRQEEKERHISQKILRLENYKNLVRELYLPRISPEKRREVQKRNSLNVRPPREQRDIKALGAEYMSIAKEMARKSQEHSLQSHQLHEETEIEVSRIKRSRSTFIRRETSEYEEARRIRVEGLVASQDDPVLKAKKLRQEMEVLEIRLGANKKLAKYNQTEEKQVETAELLFSNLKVKYGILNLLKQ